MKKGGAFGVKHLCFGLHISSFMLFSLYNSGNYENYWCHFSEGHYFFIKKFMNSVILNVCSHSMERIGENIY